MRALPPGVDTPFVSLVGGEVAARTMESIPDRLGDYELEHEIGRGGMGVVYLARQRPLGRLVALKVLPPEFTKDPVRLKRFRREADAISRLDHPSIVPIYDVGEDRGTHYIAMKYVPGVGLDDLLRMQARLRSVAAAESDEQTTIIPRESIGSAGPAGGEARAAREPAVRPTRPLVSPALSRPLSEPQWTYRAVRIVEKIARALSHLHEQGLVHRDVKPGNILLDRRGDPWLLDFGLACDLSCETVSDSEGIIGTVQYVSPEQVETSRGPVDRRSDIYSLGVTLYELVTFRRPFDYSAPSTVLHAVLYERAVPPRHFMPGLSEDLEAVILKAMDPDPALRYQTADHLAEDLRRVRTFQPVGVQRASLGARLRRFVHGNPLLAAASLCVLLSLLGLIEHVVYVQLKTVKCVAAARADADRAWEAGDFRRAAEGYAVFVRLGGDESAIQARWDRARREAQSGEDEARLQARRGR